MSYEEIIRTRILNPLGMTATDCRLPTYAQRRTSAWDMSSADELALKDFTNIGPAAEINSTAIDMAKWVELFLSGGLTGNGKIVIGKRRSSGCITMIAHRSRRRHQYGLGWNIGRPRSPRRAARSKSR